MIFRKLLTSTSVFLAGVALMTSVAFAQMYVVLGDSVNVRSASNASSKVLGQVHSNEKFEVSAFENGFGKIKYGKADGWISSNFLKKLGDVTALKSSNSKEKSKQSVSKPSTNVTNSKDTAVKDKTKSINKAVYVSKNSVNLRTGAGTNYKVQATLNKGYNLTVIGSSGDWLRVKTQRGNIGWISSGCVADGNSPKVRSVSSSPNFNGGVATSRGGDADLDGDLRSNVIAFARRYLGTPYVYGGSTKSGFDCSGFVKHVMGNFGVWLDRVAAEQAGSDYGLRRDDLVKGDLVFFDTNRGHSYINHVGIYIEDGYFIHASSGSGCVNTSSLDEDFYKSCFMGGKRVLK